jgi:hypothetical protein
MEVDEDTKPVTGATTTKKYDRTRIEIKYTF